MRNVTRFLAVSIVTIGVFLFSVAASADDNSQSARKMDHRLKPQQVKQDLQDFLEFIETKWLLSNLNDADFRSLVDDARDRIDDEIPVAELAIILQRILAHGADGHAVVTDLYPALMHDCRGYFPFSIEPLGDRYVAVKPSESRRSQLWDQSHPFIVKIEGIGIDDWVNAAMPLVSRSHDLSMRTRASSLLRYPGYFRRQLELSDSTRVAIVMESPGGQRRERTVELADVPASGRKYNAFLESVGREWAVIEPNIGYVWLEKSSAGIVRRIGEAMPKLRDTRGLILDLRENNEGGSPEFIHLLGVWLANSNRPRVVGGIERRLSGERPASNFRTYQPHDDSLTEPGCQVIRDALNESAPNWAPANDRSTLDRCSLLSSPKYEPRINHFDHPRIMELIPEDSVFEYRMPVVVLVDRHCFSAAEIAASQLRQFANVTIMGEPTIGAAGTGDSHTLPQSGLTIKAATEAVQLTPRGGLIDGVGVQPDIVVPLDLQTLSGPGDTMLQRAIDHVSR